jgi:hypothetical protein
MFFFIRGHLREIGMRRRLLLLGVPGRNLWFVDLVPLRFRDGLPLA